MLGNTVADLTCPFRLCPTPGDGGSASGRPDHAKHIPQYRFPGFPYVQDTASSLTRHVCSTNTTDSKSARSAARSDSESQTGSEATSTDFMEAWNRRCEHHTRPTHLCPMDAGRSGTASFTAPGPTAIAERHCDSRPCVGDLEDPTSYSRSLFLQTRSKRPVHQKGKGRCYI